MVKDNLFMKILIGLAFATVTFLLITIGVSLFRNVEPILFGIFCLFIGILNGDLAIVTNDNDFKYATIMNIIEISFLMSVTRLYSFISNGASRYTDPFDIFVSFSIYMTIATFASMIYLYIKGELKLGKWY